jgi:hypothetical protein
LAGVYDSRCGRNDSTWNRLRSLGQARPNVMDLENIRPVCDVEESDDEENERLISHRVTN